MTADRVWRTRCVVLGEGIAPKYVGGLTRGRTGLVVDKTLAGQRDALLAGDLSGAPTLELNAAPVTVETLRHVGRFIRQHRIQTVVGLGGGSVMDAVKLAALFTADPSLTIFVERHAKRSGLIVLPPVSYPNERPRTVLMPSTVGTGAEVSAVACLDTSVGRRLIASRHLSGDVAVLDAGNLATLPTHLLFEGLLEAFLRVAGTLIGSSSSIFDDDGYSLLVRIVRLGNRLMREDVPELRLTAAHLSMETHTGWALVGRDPYGAKHWYVANELAHVTGVRKMTATASVIGPIWAEVANGSAAWGDGGRLLKLWSVVVEADPSLDPNPAKGISELMRRWGIAGMDIISQEALVKTTDAALRNWGGGLPMLRGLDAMQVQHVLFEASLDQQELARPSGRATSGKGKGVST